MSIPQPNRRLFGILLLLLLGGSFVVFVWRDNAVKRSPAERGNASTVSTTHVPQITTSSIPTPATTTVRATPTSTSSPAVRPPSTPTPKPPAAKPAPSPIWRPKVGATFDWLDNSSLANLPASPRSIYIVDTFDVTAATISTLHKQGAHVICYINAGSWEDWRSDKAAFAETMLGNDYEGWEGERWLDIRSAALKPLMQKRFDLAKAKGCDAIDPDNINSYKHDTGFTTSEADQIAYNLWLAGEAHKRGMSIGLKNTGALLKRLLSSYDWALVEDCADQKWCADFLPFTTAGKAVLQVEYTDTGESLDSFCAEAQKNRFSAILKHRNLGKWAEYCPQ